MSDSIRVILLDDEVLIRKLVRMKLDTEKLKLEIVGEYSNAASVIEQLEEIRPDIIISDICMPGMDGISFSEQCTKILPNIKIIILTGYNDFETLYPAIAKEWDYNKNTKKPNQVRPMDNRKYWWRCGKCEHSWRASVRERTCEERKCPVCSKK